MSPSFARIKRCTYLAFVFILTVEAIFLVCEAGARIYLMHYGDLDFVQAFGTPDLLARKEIRKEIAVIPGMGYHEDLCPGYQRGLNRHNSLGFRGEEIVMPKPRGEFRIACLGGSTTYETGVKDWQKAYPAVLESVLRHRGYRVTVINAGGPGFTSRDCLVKFETLVAHLDVDMVVQCTAGNDLAFRSIWPPRHFRPDYAMPADIGTTYFHCYSIADYSVSLRLLRNLLYGDRDLDCRGQDGNEPARMLFFHAVKQYSEGIYPDGILKTVSLRDVFAANSTAPFHMNVRNIVSVATTANITPMLMTEPVFTEWLPKDAAGRDLYGVLKDGMDEINGVTRRVAEESGVLFYDLAQSWQAEARYGKYSVDFFHNNEYGAKLKAELVADFIISKMGDKLPRL